MARCGSKKSGERRTAVGAKRKARLPFGIGPPIERAFWGARPSRAWVSASRRNNLGEVRESETLSPTPETGVLPRTRKAKALARIFASHRVTSHVPDAQLQRIAQNRYRQPGHSFWLGECVARPRGGHFCRSARSRRGDPGCFSP